MADGVRSLSRDCFVNDRFTSVRGERCASVGILGGRLRIRNSLVSRLATMNAGTPAVMRAIPPILSRIIQPIDPYTGTRRHGVLLDLLRGSLNSNPIDPRVLRLFSSVAVRFSSLRSAPVLFGNEQVSSRKFHRAPGVYRIV